MFTTYQQLQTNIATIQPWLPSQVMETTQREMESLYLQGTPIDTFPHLQEALQRVQPWLPLSVKE